MGLEYSGALLGDGYQDTSGMDRVPGSIVMALNPFNECGDRRLVDNVEGMPSNKVGESLGDS